jgi:hypothetical protein
MVHTLKKKVNRIFTIKEEDGEAIFECSLNKKQCPYCSKENLCDYPYGICRDHLQSEMNLQIRPTTLPGVSGYGLFAFNGDENDTKSVIFKGIKKRSSRDDTPGQNICKYDGELMTVKEHATRYKDKLYGPYTFSNSDDKILDAACQRSPASFINHKIKSKANAKFCRNGTIQAIKNIKNGAEIFVCYDYDPKIFTKQGIEFSTEELDEA